MTSLGFKSVKAGVLSLADGIVKVELGGEIPFAIIGIVTTNVISVETEECLIGRHVWRLAVEKLHQEIELEKGGGHCEYDELWSPKRHPKTPQVKEP